MTYFAQKLITTKVKPLLAVLIFGGQCNNSLQFMLITLYNLWCDLTNKVRNPREMLPPCGTSNMTKSRLWNDRS